VDYDRDGHLDLFVATYLQFDLQTVPKLGESSNCTWKGLPVNCGPRVCRRDIAGCFETTEMGDSEKPVRRRESENPPPDIV
jgi:hypothetical protein